MSIAIPYLTPGPLRNLVSLVFNEPAIRWGLAMLIEFKGGGQYALISLI